MMFYICLLSKYIYIALKMLTLHFYKVWRLWLTFGRVMSEDGVQASQTTLQISSHQIDRIEINCGHTHVTHQLEGKADILQLST